MRPPSQVFYNQDAQSQSHRSIDSTEYQASYQGTPNNPARNQNNYYTGNEQYYISIHNVDVNENKYHLPEGTCHITSLNEESANLLGLCLFDSGSSSTLINDRAILASIKPHLGDPQRFTTTQGSYLCRKYFLARKIISPEFCKTRFVPKLLVRTFHSPT